MEAIDPLPQKKAQSTSTGKNPRGFRDFLEPSHYLPRLQGPKVKIPKTVTLAHFRSFCRKRTGNSHHKMAFLGTAGTPYLHRTENHMPSKERAQHSLAIHISTEALPIFCRGNLRISVLRTMTGTRPQSLCSRHSWSAGS